MRRKEENFTPSLVQECAEKWGRRILAGRLQRNMTQAAAAERARMSKFTWLKLEKGDVSVSMGTWLTALDILGLLTSLELPETPPPEPAAPKQRVRTSTAKTKRFDF